jgi:hypothetical protein
MAAQGEHLCYRCGTRFKRSGTHENPGKIDFSSCVVFHGHFRLEEAAILCHSCTTDVLLFLRAPVVSSDSG